jgi:hypothetical protein
MIGRELPGCWRLSHAEEFFEVPALGVAVWELYVCDVLRDALDGGTGT